MEGVERVYHSAAQVGDWGPWQRFVEVSIEGTRNMLDAASEASIKRFLYISSISAYGRGIVHETWIALCGRGLR